jgi:hypothetical protein
VVNGKGISRVQNPLDSFVLQIEVFGMGVTPVDFEARRNTNELELHLDRFVSVGES